MRLGLRILIALVLLGLIWVLWPFSAREDVTADKPRQPTGHDGRLFTTPLRDPPASEEKTKNETQEHAPKAEPNPAAATQKKLFYRVRVRDGGSLQAGDTLIVLGGITATNASTRCKDENGRDWPCGTRARAALTRLIRGRAVRCDVPASDNEAVLTARCSVADTDLSLWLVRHGWAKPKAPAEATLTEAADAARKRKAGLWR